MISSPARINVSVLWSGLQHAKEIVPPAVTTAQFPMVSRPVLQIWLLDIPPL